MVLPLLLLLPLLRLQAGSEPSGGVGSGGAKGITYSPYSDNGGCKSESQIASEVAKLSGFDVIRLYGVDCSQVEAVLKLKLHLKNFRWYFRCF